jgi:hypothetical protein
MDDKLSLIGQIQSPEKRSQEVFAAALSATDPEDARTVMRRYPLEPQRQAELEAALRQRKEGTSFVIGDDTAYWTED